MAVSGDSPKYPTPILASLLFGHLVTSSAEFSFDHMQIQGLVSPTLVFSTLQLALSRDFNNIYFGRPPDPLQWSVRFVLLFRPAKDRVSV